MLGYKLMTEREFSTKFLKWLRAKKLQGAFELKLTKGLSLPYDALKEHQLDNLLRAKHDHMAHKIADDSIGFKPFDIFALGSQPAYVVVQFWKPGEKKFYLIDVDAWLHEASQRDRKSLTEEKARKIGTICTLEMIKQSFI